MCKLFSGHCRQKTDEKQKTKNKRTESQESGIRNQELGIKTEYSIV